MCTSASLFTRLKEARGQKYEGVSRNIAVRGFLTRLRYCETCCIYRPPRTVHCAVCELCIEGFDHHCPWLGMCIGRRNYRYFLIFLSLLCVQLLFSVSLCTAHLYSLAQEEEWRGAVGSLVTVSTAGALGIMVVALWGFHIYLCSVALTTYERVKCTWSDYNPYSASSVFSNWYSVCFPQLPAKRTLTAQPVSYKAFARSKRLEQTRLSSATGAIDWEPLKAGISNLL